MADHNPGDLLQLRHLVWELAGRPLQLRYRGEGQGVQLEGWLAGPGFGAYKTAPCQSRCGMLHMRLAGRKMELVSSPMAEADYREAHLGWAGPKDGGAEPPPWMPPYARGGPRGEWLVGGTPAADLCALWAGGARVRLHWTAKGGPRWSTLRPGAPAWSPPRANGLYVDLVVEGCVKLATPPGSAEDRRYVVERVLQEPSAADMGRLRSLLLKHRLEQM